MELLRVKLGATASEQSESALQASTGTVVGIRAISAPKRAVET